MKTHRFNNEQLKKEWSLEELLRANSFRPSEDTKYHFFGDEIFINQSTNCRFAVLVHSIRETSMDSYDARITILKNKQSPRLFLDHEKELFTSDPYNKNNITFSQDNNYVFWYSTYSFKDLNKNYPTIVVIDLNSKNFAFYLLPGYNLKEVTQISPYNFKLKINTPKDKLKENTLNLKNLKWHDKKETDYMGDNFKKMIIDI